MEQLDNMATMRADLAAMSLLGMLLVLRPMVYAGAQHVAPTRSVLRVPSVAVSALALWPLPKRASVQVQWIQPIRPDQPALIRLAADVRVF